MNRLRGIVGSLGIAACVVVAVAIYVLLAVFRRRNYLVLEDGLLRKGKRAWSLDTIERVHASRWSRSEYDLCVVVNGVPETIARGDEALVEAAAKQIESVLSERISGRVSG